MRSHLIHDLLHRLAPAIAGEGVGIASIDDERAGEALADIRAPQLHLGGAADVAGEHARHAGALCQFNIGDIAAAPVFIPGARDAGRDPGDGRKGGEGRGEWRNVVAHGCVG